MSGGLELREKALACGLLPRILERLAAISGEKPRVFEEATEDAEAAAAEQAALEKAKEDPGKKEQPEKNTQKKARKGVGYSSKQG